MRLLEICEEADDVRVFDEAMEAIRQGEELVPAEVVNRLIEGENPIKVWRQHRGMSQAALARAAGIKAAYLSQLEMGARKGSVTVLCALASTLKGGRGSVNFSQIAIGSGTGVSFPSPECWLCLPGVVLCALKHQAQARYHMAKGGNFRAQDWM
jgi:DNA-binding XRE family transcriptional regulator